MNHADLLFLHSGADLRCTARVDKQFDGYHTLQLMTAGGVSLSYDEQAYQLEGAWFWPAFPGPRIRFHAAPGVPFWEHRYVAFSGPRVETWRARGWLLTTPQAAPTGGNYAPVFDELLSFAGRADLWGTLRAVNLLERLLLELAEARAQTQADAPWLEHVLARLAEAKDAPPDYALLARDVGMGLSTLRRRFARATGASLHEHWLTGRITAARALLGGTDLPLKAIAERLGYSDVYFFGRQFRERVGVTPGAYRRSRQT